MSGYAQLPVPPGTFDAAPGLGGTLAGQWYRGIPTPGLFGPVSGVADFKNLLSMSPPTLLERYELYSYAIGFGVLLVSGGAFAATPTISAELALLVNDRVAYTAIETMVTTELAVGVNMATGAWSSDLVNPIRINARERLSLRVGFISDQPTTVHGLIVAGAQLDNAGTAKAYESTISYNVIDLPASRRL